MNFLATCGFHSYEQENAAKVCSFLSVENESIDLNSSHSSYHVIPFTNIVCVRTLDVTNFSIYLVQPSILARLVLSQRCRAMMKGTEEPPYKLSTWLDEHRFISYALTTLTFAIIMLLLLFHLVAATTTAPLHPHVFAAAAAATSPNPSSSHHLKTNTKIHFLDYIGNKFESTAIATHNTIIQKAKEEYNYELVPAEVPPTTPTTVPTSTSSSSWNTYNPTFSVNGGANLWTTEGPTNKSTLAWYNDDDVHSNHGQGNVEEVEVEEISSPTVYCHRHFLRSNSRHHLRLQSSMRIRILLHTFSFL